MSVIVKCGGGKSSGLYVWKKYEYDEKYFDAPVSFVIAGASGSNFLINVSSDKLDLSSVDATFFEGYTATFMNSGNAIDCAFEANGVVKVIVRSSGSTQSLTYSYNATSQQITVYNTNIGTDWIASPVLKSGKEAFYITNVVSDSPTAYPDGGTQDGYWYEKVVEGIPSPAGFTKVTVDTFTPTSNQRLNTTTIEHSHGSIPTLCVVIGNPLTTSNVPFQVGAINGSQKYGIMLGEGTGYWKAGAVLTANNFRFNESYGFNFIAGAEYTVICMS